MERPSYLSKYLFDWEVLEIFLEGKSSLDTAHFVGPINTMKEAGDFLKGYGFNPDDPVLMAELFGNFQEALQFIKRYFLKEGTPLGLDLKIPPAIFMITDVCELFVMASSDEKDVEKKMWAEIILKVLHTIVHVDRDWRSSYFSVIQTQIFDRFYKHIFRNSKDQLYVAVKKNSSERIPLVDFSSKSRKSRDSVILKLLHKADNVAEELFDRVGVRFITKSSFDNLRLIKFFLDNNIVIPQNIKPSRSINTIFDLEKLRNSFGELVKEAEKENYDEEVFTQKMEEMAKDCHLDEKNFPKNIHSSKAYRSIQFTGRHLIRYKNPFFEEFNELRQVARGDEGSTLAQKVLAMDISLISRDVRFFFPYEVQIVDEKNQQSNTKGEASHQEYKKAQQVTSLIRLFRPLMELKGLKVDDLIVD
ncbi:MAG: TIGR04552 family protein [Deltaproteobacteria bacterium]|nr:MAG: TIGR04552 family protein [Deltaproteobacteria bacterium]